LAGVKAKLSVDGVSLARHLRGEMQAMPDRMLVIDYSRMDAPVPVKEGAGVLWNHWRLLQDKELYDLATDPAQKTNVLQSFPDIAGRMRAHLDRWWAGVAPTLNEYGAVVVGNKAENPVQLSPSDWQDSFLDQGAQVRSGLPRNGVWNVVVDAAGEYEIELRRWAREADAPIASALPPVKHFDGVYPAGVALPITKARLQIAGFDESRAVSPDDKVVIFTARLKPGPAQLQTWFSDADGKELCGAYYVYVRRK